VGAEGINVDAIAHQDCDLLDWQAVSAEGFYLFALGCSRLKGWSASAWLRSTTVWIACATLLPFCLSWFFFSGLFLA
jgi:hypothetical protein